RFCSAGNFHCDALVSQYRRFYFDSKVTNLYDLCRWWLIMGMSASLWKSATKTNVKHNNREQDKYDNKEIDVSRFKYNKYLVQESLRELYAREFDDALEKYNAKQTRNDRKIKSYYENIAKGKKKSLQHEIIVKVGSGFHRKDYEFGDSD